MSAIRIDLSPSWILAAAIITLHGAAAAAVLAVMPGAAGAALAAGLAALGLAAAWSRALLAAGASPRAIELSGELASVELRDGTLLAAQSGKGHVSRILVALPVRGRTLLVSRDMLGGDDFRRLRLWALWGRLPTRRGGSVAAKQLRG